MNREIFDRILTEEGVDDAYLRNKLWLSRPGDNLGEKQLRDAARLFKRNLPGLRVKQALNDAMDREYGRDR